MSTYVGDVLVAGCSYVPNILDFKWSDHILNDVQWLRADTFSWQSGSVYEAAYNHLVDDIEDSSYIYMSGNNFYRSKTDDVSGASYPYAWKRSSDNLMLYSNTLTPDPQTDMVNSSSDGTGASMYIDAFGYTTQTETIAGTTIQYILADDGHKICVASEESNVVSIYNATGVAWYYIIDITNQRFKLPRTKFGFTGLRDTVGNYVETGLPNITGSFYSGAKVEYAYGAFSIGDNKYNGNTSGSTNNYVMFDASKSNSIYGNSTTVQPPATQMYLYFYVGNFTQTALENTAGLNAELFNDKVDKGHQVIAFQAPTSANGYVWYRKYADGWVEQGGWVNSNTVASVILPITMADT